MTTSILMPALSPTMEEGTLGKWMVREGDVVEPGDLLAEIETDKTTMEIEAVDQGRVAKILIPEGTDNVKVNTPIAVIVEEDEEFDPDTFGPAKIEPNNEPSLETEAQAHAAPESSVIGKTNVEVAEKKSSRMFASPLARRIARQNNLDLHAISGTGPRGRIVKSDVLAAVSLPGKTVDSAPQVKVVAQGPEADQVARMYADREYEVVELDSMRTTVAKRLTEAKQTIPHFYLRRSIKLDALLAMRAELNTSLAETNTKLSINDFIIVATAKSLHRIPDANAVWANGTVFRFKSADVAVAVAVEGGLFTPVIRDANQKSITSISEEMKDLATRARTRRLKPHEYVGGSCTISNLGMYGIENFDAVINPPHASILAVGSGTKKPVIDENGGIGSATLMSVTLSVDHRVIDGALGAQLLDSIVNYLEAPLMLLL